MNHLSLQRRKLWPERGSHLPKVTAPCHTCARTHPCAQTHLCARIFPLGTFFFFFTYSTWTQELRGQLSSVRQDSPFEKVWPTPRGAPRAVLGGSASIWSVPIGPALATLDPSLLGSHHPLPCTRLHMPLSLPVLLGARVFRYVRSLSYRTSLGRWYGTATHIPVAFFPYFKAQWPCVLCQFTSLRGDVLWPSQPAPLPSLHGRSAVPGNGGLSEAALRQLL